MLLTSYVCVINGCHTNFTHADILSLLDSTGNTRSIRRVFVFLCGFIGSQCELGAITLIFINKLEENQ